MSLANYDPQKTMSVNSNLFSPLRRKQRNFIVSIASKNHLKAIQLSEFKLHGHVSNSSTDRSTSATQENNKSSKINEPPRIDVLSAEDLLANAKKMESSRTALTRRLLESETGVTELSAEFLHQIRSGIDLSDLVNKAISENKVPVQNSGLVEDTSNELEHKLIHCFESLINASMGKDMLDLRTEAFKLLKTVHFLPNFLLRVSDNLGRNHSTDDHNNLLEHIKHYTKEMTQARQVMINGNLRLVQFVARQYQHESITFSDLSQEGTVGLIKAVDRYDWQRSVRFSTYAVYWIRQSMNRAVIRQQKIVRLPYNIAEKTSVVFEMMSHFWKENNKWPTQIELAALCKIPEEEIKVILENHQPTVSLQSNLNDDEEMPEYESSLEQHHFPQPLNILASYALKNFLRQAISTLSQREADIINSRFGLDNHYEMTLQEIATNLSLTRERVRQIQNLALQKLKNNFKSDLSDFLEPG